MLCPRQAARKNVFLLPPRCVFYTTRCPPLRGVLVLNRIKSALKREAPFFADYLQNRTVYKRHPTVSDGIYIYIYPSVLSSCSPSYCTFVYRPQTFYIPRIATNCICMFFVFLRSIFKKSRTSALYFFFGVYTKCGKMMIKLFLIIFSYIFLKLSAKSLCVMSHTFCH